MAERDYFCKECREVFQHEENTWSAWMRCPKCNGVAREIGFIGVGVIGSRKGPGCGSGQLGNMVRYDLKKEAQIVGQKMEEAGAFSGPDGATTYAAFKKKHDSIMNRPDHLTSFDREKSDNA